MKTDFQIGLLFTQLFGSFIAYAIVLFRETGFSKLFFIYALISFICLAVQIYFVSKVKLDDK